MSASITAAGAPVTMPAVSVAAGGTAQKSSTSSPSSAGGIEQRGAVQTGLQSNAVDKVSLINRVQASRKSGEARSAEGSRLSSVLFAYNYKGDLRIRYMDSVNKLVYQTPPVLIARMMDLMARPDSSVSTTV